MWAITSHAECRTLQLHGRRPLPALARPGSRCALILRLGRSYCTCTCLLTPVSAVIRVTGFTEAVDRVTFLSGLGKGSHSKREPKRTDRWFAFVIKRGKRADTTSVDLSSTVSINNQPLAAGVRGIAVINRVALLE
ncbi:hypothetical protein J6590_039360 [Homalodisca vitripennis]|nr:hypothetical protein J6590_039360 [Homalodisca vitripennis]